MLEEIAEDMYHREQSAANLSVARSEPELESMTDAWSVRNGWTSMSRKADPDEDDDDDDDVLEDGVHVLGR